ncbi:MAG: tRNA-modifying protein YgfZ [Verrucomicrobia bacterium]|nr:MAG: tRNA-modifying protein YgfZ [Verrucomicrobiota bacterium]
MTALAYVWREPRTVLEVSGPDAAEFLQGQFTNDLSGAAEQRPCVYGLWLDVKGRVLADAHVLRLDDERFLLFSFEVSAGVIRDRLEAYIIADEVDVADVSEAWAGWVVWGSTAAAALETAGMDGEGAPDWGRFSRTSGGGFCFRSRDLGRAVASWHVVCPAAAQDEWGTRLANGHERDADWLDWTRCRAGIPRVPREIGPTDLPNEAGLDAEAISYTKGCYLGQEVMARLKHLGQVRRRLYIVGVEGVDAAAAAALSLPAPLSPAEGGRAIGELRSLYPREGGQTVGMAMLRTADAAPGAVLSIEGVPGGQVVVEAVAEGRAVP